MKLAICIARRYLLAKKSQNVINVISLISTVGVLTASMALLMVLSVFNGLHGFVGDLYGHIDPDLKLTPVSGKVISLDSVAMDQIRKVEGVEVVSEALEDQALLKFAKRRMPAMVMGVDSLYAQVCEIDSIIVEGTYQVRRNGENKGVIGLLLADQLALRINFVSPLVIYAPKRTARISAMSSQNSFNQEYINPSGIFAVRQSEYDSQYLIVNIEQARRLFEYDDKVVSSLSVKVAANASVASVKKSLEKIVKGQLLVKNREEQHEAFFKMMKVEKLVAYLILSFILVIAAFNVIGTLSMLIYEKKESIFTLKSMGASRSLVTRIFLLEGLMISLLGVIVGLVIGVVLVVIQEQFGIVKFYGGGNYLVEAYPVSLLWSDVFAVLVTVCVIAFLAAWYPVRVIVRRYYSETGTL